MAKSKLLEMVKHHDAMKLAQVLNVKTLMEVQAQLQEIQEGFDESKSEGNSLTESQTQKQHKLELKVRELEKCKEEQALWRLNLSKLDGQVKDIQREL